MLIYSPAFETARRRFTVRFIVVPLLALTGAACGACELSETWPDTDATSTTTAWCRERSTESECRHAVGAGRTVNRTPRIAAGPSPSSA
jgi:hypothetical protein